MVKLEQLAALLAALFFTIAGFHEAGHDVPDWFADPAYWWQTPDQAGAEQYAAGRYRAASEHFHSAAWRGTACYRAADYACAERAFTQADMTVAERQFNLGNVAARAGRLAQALTAYDAALAARPDWSPAVHNREIVLKLIVDRGKRPAPKKLGEPGDPNLDPDQVEIDKNGAHGKRGRMDIEKLDPNSLAQLWLRQINSDAGDFLRLRFADEAARQGGKR
jgi:Ca-activated chloride channel family protein